MQQKIGDGTRKKRNNPTSCAGACLTEEHASGLKRCRIHRATCRGRIANRVGPNAAKKCKTKQNLQLHLPCLPLNKHQLAGTKPSSAALRSKGRLLYGDKRCGQQYQGYSSGTLRASSIHILNRKLTSVSQACKSTAGLMTPPLRCLP